MAFTESIKNIVKKKSHLQCCLCKEIGIEIHHIIPQCEDGPDIESNAAPLCPSCHEIYGDNPKKRKFITEARDIWYEICKTRYSFDTKELLEIKNTVNNLATTDSLQDIKEQILNAITVNNKPNIHEIIGKASKSENSETIKELDIYELLTYIYHSRSRRSDTNHEMILMPQFWPEEEGRDEVLNDFIKQFGYTTAVIVVNNIMDELDIPDEDGLTEPEINEILHLASTEMIIMTICCEKSLVAILRESGELSWERIAEVKIK